MLTHFLKLYVPRQRYSNPKYIAYFRFLYWFPFFWLSFYLYLSLFGTLFAHKHNLLLHFSLSSLLIDIAVRVVPFCYLDENCHMNDATTECKFSTINQSYIRLGTAGTGTLREIRDADMCVANCH